MLETANATFKINRSGRLDIQHKPHFTLPKLSLIELFYIVQRATTEARRRKIKKPDQYREY